MTEQIERLAKKVKENPDDALLRLVYADALDESGKVELAIWHRLTALEGVADCNNDADRNSCPPGCMVRRTRDTMCDLAYSKHIDYTGWVMDAYWDAKDEQWQKYDYAQGGTMTFADDKVKEFRRAAMEAGLKAVELVMERYCESRSGILQ